MSWDEQLRVLGASPVGSERLSPLDEGEVRNIESMIGAALPPDYKMFLRQFGSCDLDQYAVFPTPGGGVAPGTFFGRDLPTAIDEYKDRLPTSVLPINDDGASNLICLSLRPDTYGEVYFQNHSTGADRLIQDLEAAKFGTLAYLAPSFGSFILGLTAD